MLDCEQILYQKYISKFLEVNVMPYVNKFEKQGGFDRVLIREIGKEGFLGANIPKEYGGSNLNMIQIGILNEQFAKASSSVRSILTVQGMLELAILRWGTKIQRNAWLPKLASGELVGSFALAEQEAGSDAGNVQMEAVKSDNHYILNGKKIWITMGQIADLYLVFANCNGKSTAFLVEKSPSVLVEPVDGLLGVRASMIANLTFHNCVVPKENVLGIEGAGLEYIASSCLDYGRYTVAWSCLGISQACVDLCIDYVKERKQFGVALREQQLIQQMITQMVINTKAVRLYCNNIAKLREEGDPDSIIETWSAKYLASKVANDVVSKAVQIFGANGCFDKYPIERYFRDAKINEIIEGTSQLHEIIIASNYT